MEGGLTGAVGRGHAGRRHDQLHEPDALQGIESEYAPRRARFTRAGDGLLLYEFTIDDPETFTSGWSAVLPMVKADGAIYEYACHEGNYGLANVLSGARAEERAAAEAAARGDR